MHVTLPISSTRRLTVLYSRASGFRAAVWTRERYLETWGTLPPWFGTDQEGGAGVREPRRPRRPDRGGAAAIDAHRGVT